MGHDIAIGSSAHTYISGNWGHLEDLFHIRQIHGHNNCDGRISRRLRAALVALKQLGYEPPENEEERERWQNNLRVDGWGQWKAGVKVTLRKGQKVRFMKAQILNGREYWDGCVAQDGAGIYCVGEPDAKTMVAIDVDDTGLVLVLSQTEFRLCCDFDSFDCHCMFAAILRHFLDLAETYPSEIWLSDNLPSTGGQLLEGVLPWSANKDEKNETKTGLLRFVPQGLQGIREGNGYTIYVRDALEPEVKTYAQAMKYHLESLRQQDEICAEAWFQVALQMPDCPQMFSGLRFERE